MANLKLREGEELKMQFHGDYYAPKFLFIKEKKDGKYSLTNERIVFRTIFGYTFEAEYADIESVERFMPLLGIKITLHNGKKHYLSIYNRKPTVDFLKEMIYRQY